MYVTGLTLSLKSKEQDGWESCSDGDDDDSDGEWIDVHHSSDEEQVCTLVFTTGTSHKPLD